MGKTFRNYVDLIKSRHKLDKDTSDLHISAKTMHETMMRKFNTSRTNHGFDEDRRITAEMYKQALTELNLLFPEKEGIRHEISDLERRWYRDFMKAYEDFPHSYPTHFYPLLPDAFRWYDNPSGKPMAKSRRSEWGTRY